MIFSLSPCVLRIHLFAWICGSTMSGHRRDFERIRALSTESWSLGSLSITHWRMITSSPITTLSWKDWEEGTAFFFMVSIHEVMAWFRYFARKTPRYATMPEEIRTSPVSFSSCTPSFADDSVQRVFSPPRPLMSFSAVPSRLEQVSYCCCRSAFFAFAASRSATSRATFSCTSFSIACFSASWPIAVPKVCSASASCAFFGPTIFATES
mmetsp:Transcript_24976/g.66020  ORF Transcript_24976/g.66020 Transcript_24976/m.66020 type:complete len:210 (-) Transcript_24976:155-784(-)